MTIPTTKRKETTAGDGANKTFPWQNFLIPTSDELKVTHTDANGVEMDITSNFTINTGIGLAAGGTINYPDSGSAISSSEKITIYRQKTQTQGISLRNQKTFFPKTHEAVFDNLAMSIIDMQEQLDRSVKVGISSSTDPDALIAQLTADAAAAAASASAASTSETNAGNSATAAAASAVAAAASAAEGLYNDVISISNADSPYVPSAAQEGTLFRVDTSAGAVVVNLSALSVYAEDMKFAFVRVNGANDITLNRGGSDTFNNAATSYVIDDDFVVHDIIGDTGTSNWITKNNVADAASLSLANTFTGVNTFSNDVVINGDLLTPSDGALTISSGVITVTGASHTIDTESAAAIDDLDTINGFQDGAVVTFSTQDGTRDILFKHGTGNIRLPNSQDILMTGAFAEVTLYYDGANSVWRLKSNNRNNYPAFLAQASTAQTNETGDGTQYTVVFDSEKFDRDGNFDGTSTFTAPVEGVYQFNVMVAYSGTLAGHNAGILRLVTSNRTFLKGYDPQGIISGSGDNNVSFSMLADMDAGDTATVTLTISGSTKVIDLITAHTWFSGHLVA